MYKTILMHPLKIFIAAFLAFITIPSFAQKNKYDIGVETGTGLSFMYEPKDATSNSMPVIGYCGGVSFQYNFKKIFSVKTELLYEKKGGKNNVLTDTDRSNDYASAMAHYKLHYLVLPVLARATFGKKINFFINAGPYFALLLKSKAQLNFIDFPKENRDYTSGSKKFDIGITTGAGITIPVYQNLEVSFEARNNLGFLALVKAGDQRLNTTNILASIVYKLGTR